jgi:hypothetical protein
MAMVSSYKNQLKSAESAVTSARRDRDRKRTKLRGVEKDIKKLEDKLRQARSKSQVRITESQLRMKNGSLASASRDLERAESALSKAEDKVGEKQKKLRNEEERERKETEKKSAEAKKRAEREEGRRREQEKRAAQIAEAERAAREAQQDDRIGELEERLLESERQKAPPEITVLFLASSPQNEIPLRLDKETREIQKRMRESEHRDSIFVEWRLARQLGDLIQDLNEVRPNILHFSGHGNDAELAFEDDAGCSSPLSNEQIKHLLGAAPEPIRLILFNSCNSLSQAQVSAEHVDIAIGMETAIGDDEARTFAGQFYNALGFGASVAKAFDQARLQIEFEHGDGRHIPRLIAADGVDPATVVLVNPDN